MIVMKFGGTSVENEAAINRVADIVLGRLQERPVVVVSAMAGVTDALLAMSSAVASGSLPEALKLLRKIRQRHLAVLSALAMGRGKPPSAGRSMNCSTPCRMCCAACRLWAS